MRLLEFDRWLFEYLTLHVNPPWLQAWAEKIGDLRSYTVPAIVFCALYYWLNSPRFFRFAIALALLLVCSEGVAYLLKSLIARPRPAVEWLIYVDPGAWGFPSAHSVNSMAMAVFLARWFHKRFWWFLPFPLLIGASRVLANYHFPLDVIGGWILGAIVAALFLALQSVRRTNPGLRASHKGAPKKGQGAPNGTKRK